MSQVKKFNQAPYFDDFDEANNFLRVLFRPGYAVQTRELNQLQSILQDQIGIISDFAVEDRSRIIGGETKLFTKMPYIKLAEDAVINIDLEDATFVTAAGVEGTVSFVDTIPSTNDTIVFVKYENTSPDGLTQTVLDNELITFTKDAVSHIVASAPTDANNEAVGVVMNAGIFYVNKSFIRTDKQLIIINYDGSNIDDKDISIGFIINDTIVKPETDISLLDNASGTPNETAPGAHRHRSEVVLVRKEDVSENDIAEYIELIRIINGEVAAKPRSDNEFTVLEQILARRTYDQSGDYIVQDFGIDILEHLNTGDNGGMYEVSEGGNTNKVVAKVGAGIGYIRGYEVRPAGNQYVDIDKARSTASVQNAIVQTQYKNSIVCYDLSGLPSIGAKLKLIDASSNVVGYAHTHSVSYSGQADIGGLKDIYSITIKGVSFNTDKTWSDVITVEHDDSVSSTYPFEATLVSYEVDPRETKMVYKLPYSFSQAVTPRVTKYFKQIETVSSDAIVTISTFSAVETFDDERSSILVYADYNGGKVGVPQSINLIDDQNMSVNIENIVGTATPGNINVKILVPVFCTAPAIRTKSLVTSFTNAGLSPAKVIKLTKADIFKIDSIITDSGVDMTDSFTLDTGARDDHYDFGSIVLKSGEPLPTSNVTVVYSYFEHSGTGDFFSPESYDSIEYTDIPYYTTTNGQNIFLGSAIDYRQRKTSSGNIETIARGAFIPDSQVITDITFYMGRQDRVMITKRGHAVVVSGTPSLSPVLPAELDDAITLYVLDVPPYTMSTSDITIMKLDHKRYTMKDIGKLENRLTTVEDVALLSSLERDVMDTDFEDRFKSGFVVDNFANGNVADFSSPEHRIAFDLVKNEIRPMNVSTFVDIKLSPGFSGIKKHAGGIITLDYTVKPLIQQMLASTTVRIQPFMVYDYVGNLTLVPGSDIWFESQDTINAQTNNAVYYTSGLFNSSASASSSTSSNTNLFDGSMLAGTWNFVGGVWRRQDGKVANATEAAQLNSIANKAPTVNTIWGIASQSSSTTVTIDSKEVAIPFIRARTVSFVGTGLKPGTKVYASFDGVDVSQYITPDDGSLGDSLRVNGNGTISGKFAIPGGKFKTGSRVFKLSDNPKPREDYISTAAMFTYTAEGTLKQETASVIRDQRQNIWSDPIAQSFFIEESTCPGGAFIESIDLYLAPFESNRHTITVEIRKMVNGYPSSLPIYSHATSEVFPGAIGGSADGSVATRCTFNAPVYLPANDEYSFVVLSGSEKLAVWCSELGQRAYKTGDTLKPSGQIISKQPYLGVMFMSQNSTTWSADQLKDIKFSINACNFVSNGSARLINKIPADDVLTESNIHRRLLINNPLYFTKTSGDIYIAGWGHGMSVGDTFKLQKDDAAGTMFGIDVAEIFNVEHTVTESDVFGFKFAIASTATGTGRQGGGNVYAENWIVDYSYIQLVSDDIVFESTDISYNVASKLKDNISGAWINKNAVNGDEIVDLGRLMAVSTNETMRVNVSLTSSNSNLSPVIYEDRIGVNVISNVINNTTLIDGSGIRQAKSSPARYVQKQVTLVNPANELSVIFDANIAPGTLVNVYYKVGQTSVDEQTEWRKMDISKTIQFTSNPNEFYTQRFKKEFNNEFRVFSVMLELVSTDKTRAPRVRDYRALALNG